MATDDTTLEDFMPAEQDVLEFVMHCSGKTLDDINARWCLLQAWAIGELDASDQSFPPPERRANRDDR